MRLVAVVHEIVEIFIEGGCLHLATLVRDCDDFVLGKLYGSRLVYVDMAGIHRYHALILVQKGIYDRGVGLGATGEKEYVCVVIVACLHDLTLCLLAKLIIAVWQRQHAVRIVEPFQYLRMRPVTVIIIKYDHVFSCFARKGTKEF